MTSLTRENRERHSNLIYGVASRKIAKWAVRLLQYRTVCLNPFGSRGQRQSTGKSGLTELYINRVSAQQCGWLDAAGGYWMFSSGLTGLTLGVREDQEEDTPSSQYRDTISYGGEMQQESLMNGPRRRV